MNVLHVLTIKYRGPKNMGGSKIIIKSERFRQTKWISYESNSGDMFEQASRFLEKIGFDILGTGEGKDCFYLISSTLKPLKGE